MIVVDANILLYAIDRDSPRHVRARRWWEETLSGTVDVRLPWIVILAFVRLTTRAAVVKRPLPVEAALEYVDSWLDQPFVAVAEPGPRHWSILKGLLVDAGTGGNLTSDAHVAALAIEAGCPLYSTDADFGRFRGLERVDPLA